MAFCIVRSSYALARNTYKVGVQFPIRILTSKMQGRHRNQSVRLIWGQHGSNLLTDYAVSGVGWREPNPGFCMELENLAGDDKGKGTSGSPTRPKVLRRQPAADCSVSSVETG
jgi:hypothetical protein